MPDTAPPPKRPKPENDAFVVELESGTAETVNAYFGIQDRGGEPAPHIENLKAALHSTNGPDFVELGRHTDIPDAVTTVFNAYWKSPSAFAEWRASSGIRHWLRGKGLPGGPVGLWAEVARIPTDLLETLYSHRIDIGMARFAENLPETPCHGYWGGIRDRVAAYRTEDLVNPDGPKPVENERLGDTLGAAFMVDMPANVCLANGNGDWTDSEGQERDIYLNSVHPAFENGNAYLRDEPEDAGCYSCYTLRMCDASGRDLDRVSLVAYFVALADLERWTSKHKTHQEIFGRFMNMVHTMKAMPKFRLWHEVSVLPKGHLFGVYVNCDRRTGFLRFGNARPLDADGEAVF